MINNRPVLVSQTGESIVAEGDISENELSWFFTLDIDYDEIIRRMQIEPTFKSIIDYSRGIHILRQPLFESLISFILSQNNNIRRITKLVESLCCTYGKAVGNGFHTFPDSAVLASLTCTDLRNLSVGFRDRYILDAARKWVSGEINIDTVNNAPLIEARAELMKITGVGSKVANCTLLFGASRFDAFPEDVWIKRAMNVLFPEGLSENLKPFAGIIQQYIFYYARENLKKTI